MRAVFSADGQDYLTEMAQPLDWTLHVPLGHEREMSQQAKIEKHELQQFSEAETIRRFELMKEKREQAKRNSGVTASTANGEEEHEFTTSELVAKIKKQHQGSWTWASKSMRKNRASKQHNYTMSVSKGKTFDFKFKDIEDEEGFDYEAAAKNTTVVVKRAVPSLSCVWTPTWDLSAELWEGLSRLDSPKRRGLWSLISEADGILPEKMRQRAAAVLVYSYRCYLAKVEARQLLAVYQMRMYIRLQCNVRMAVARRVLPRLRLEMASVFEEREVT